MTKKELYEDFLDEPGEVHALWLGFYSSFSHAVRLDIPSEFEDALRRNYHYYTFGFWIGRSFQIVCALVAAKLGAGVIY